MMIREVAPKAFVDAMHKQFQPRWADRMLEVDHFSALGEEVMSLIETKKLLDAMIVFAGLHINTDFGWEEIADAAECILTRD